MARKKSTKKNKPPKAKKKVAAQKTAKKPAAKKASVRKAAAKSKPAKMNLATAKKSEAKRGLAKKRPVERRIRGKADIVDGAEIEVRGLGPKFGGQSGDLQGLSGESEVTAMKASGITFSRIVAPLLFAGFAMSLVTLFLQEAIVPFATDRATSSTPCHTPANA